MRWGLMADAEYASPEITLKKHSMNVVNSSVSMRIICRRHIEQLTQL